MKFDTMINKIMEHHVENLPYIMTGFLMNKVKIWQHLANVDAILCSTVDNVTKNMCTCYVSFYDISRVLKMACRR